MILGGEVFIREVLGQCDSSRLAPLPYRLPTVDELNKSHDGYHIVGKVRPWDAGDDSYILYADGDLYLVRVNENELVV